jgi:predicted 3-demethylubiquinone-9 3-methyltransferase (glyoxalase superfamily)
MAKEFRYKPQYGVIVICESEEEQKKVFEELQKEGKKLKVVTT